MDKPLNIAVVGAGYMGQNHVKILSALPDVNLVAICDIDIAKTKKAAKQYKIRSYNKIGVLFEKEELGAVTICAPTSLHYKISKEFITRKIPTFIEKPITATISEAKKLIKLSQKNHTQVMIGHIERFNPVVNEIKLRIKSGEIGKIIKIHTQRFSPPTSSQQDVSVIIDLATHDIDVIGYLLDDTPARIFAETRKVFSKHEDLMSAILKFKNGVIGIIEVSWLHPTKVRSLNIIGTNGMYHANYITQELLFYKQNQALFPNNIDAYAAATKADVVKVAFQSKEPLYLELKAFVDTVKNRRKMPVSAENGLLALEIAEKFTKSGTLHRLIR